MPAYCGRRHFWSIEMSEYPKALYKGDNKHYQFTTVENEAQEAEFRENEYVSFHELPAHVEQPQHMGESVDSSNVNGLKHELLEALQKNEEKDEEILTLKQTYISENNKLRKQVRWLELGNLGAGDLQKILEDKQVKFGARDSKEELVKLVFDSEYPVETEEE